MQMHYKNPKTAGDAGAEKWRIRCNVYNATGSTLLSPWHTPHFLPPKVPLLPIPARCPPSPQTECLDTWMVHMMHGCQTQHCHCIWSTKREDLVPSMEGTNRIGAWVENLVQLSLHQPKVLQICYKAHLQRLMSWQHWPNDLHWLPGTVSNSSIGQCR